VIFSTSGHVLAILAELDNPGGAIIALQLDDLLQSEVVEIIVGLLNQLRSDSSVLRDSKRVIHF
jgi:hypothetical protein